MNYEKWEPLYLEIIRDFGYDIEEDEKSAMMLIKLLRPEQLMIDVEKNLNAIISGQQCIIIGPCISIDKILSLLSVRIDAGKTKLVTVGEGTKKCVELGFVPDMIFTDLDGYPSLDLRANQKGAILFIHAHGDNIPWLKEWVPRFVGRVIPTCQCRPMPGIFNWGGFTDGDRAYCTLRQFDAADVKMIGFDFKRPCGDKRMNIAIKMKKLSWAEKIIAVNDQSRNC